MTKVAARSWITAEILMDSEENRFVVQPSPKTCHHRYRRRGNRDAEPRHREEKHQAAQ